MVGVMMGRVATQVGVGLRVGGVVGDGEGRVRAGAVVEGREPDCWAENGVAVGEAGSAGAHAPVRAVQMIVTTNQVGQRVLRFTSTSVSMLTY